MASPRTGQAAPKKTAAKKTAAKKTAKRASTTARAAATAAQRDLPARVEAAAQRVMAWLRRRAPGAAAQLRPGASDEALEALAAALKKPLPAELVALWKLVAGLPIFEYDGLGPRASMLRRAGLEELRARGVFKTHEVFAQTVARVRATKWHPGWIPLAEDSCGNMYCLDLAPGPAGRVGQIIRWETAGGPFAAASADLAEVLERYAQALESDCHEYDADSGVFDGPYIDLLVPSRR